VEKMKKRRFGEDPLVEDRNARKEYRESWFQRELLGKSENENEFNSELKNGKSERLDKTYVAAEKTCCDEPRWHTLFYATVSLWDKII